MAAHKNFAFRLNVQMLFASITMASGLLALAHPALGQRATPCDSCESCSRALAAPNARVELNSDLVLDGEGPCVVIKGAGAIFDGLERDIRPLAGENTVGVRVEAAGAMVRNLHVVGAAVAFEVVGAKEVGLFHNYVEATGFGVYAEQAAELRLTRNVLLGGKAAVALGAGRDGSCEDGSPLTLPGVVINNNHIERADIGILACGAAPVVRNNRLVRNRVGIDARTVAITAGASPPQSGPWDPCICAPGWEGVSAGSAIFYSSGCKACEVHEEWLPDLRAKGHEVVVRPSGPENEAASARFDVWAGYCTPQMLDAIGISGCVPNYACMVNDLTFKVRRGQDALDREVEVNSAEQLAEFEKSCQDAARAHYRTGEEAKTKGCAIHPIHDNIICESLDKDVANPAQLPEAANNACGTCAKSCPPPLATPEPPGPRLKGGSVAAAPPRPSSPEPSDPPPAPPTPAPTPQVVPDSPPVNTSADTTSTHSNAATTGSANEPTEATAQVADGSQKLWALIAMGALALAAIFAVLWLRATAKAKQSGPQA